MMGGGGGEGSLRISFLGAVYCFRVSFIFEPVYFLGYEFDVMAVPGAVCAFY